MGTNENDNESAGTDSIDVSDALLKQNVDKSTEAIKAKTAATEEGEGAISKYSAAGYAAVVAMGSLDGELGKVARTITATMNEAMKANIKQTNEQAAFVRGLNADVIDLNKSIGGLGQGLLASGKPLGAFAQKSLDLQTSVRKAQRGIGDATVMVEDSTGRQVNAFDKLFKSTKDINTATAQITSNLVKGNARITHEMSDQTLTNLVNLGKAANISGDEIATMLENQYALTGEVNEKHVENVIKVAKSLETATGLPLQKLKNDIIDITSDIDRFGDIGEKAAGRLSATFQQLGLDLKTFTGMTDKFMDFDSSAKLVGDMSAVFGIQMDAMEMTYLANEDQEEFLNRMREDVLAAGHDVENMSQARQKLLADQMGLNVKQMQTFMRDGDAASLIGQDDLMAATDKSDDLDAMQTAFDSFADSTVGATRTAAEAMESQMDAAAAASVKSLAKLEVQAGRSMTAVQNIKISEKNIKAMENMFDLYGATIGETTVAISGLTSTIITSAADVGSGAINTAADGLVETRALLENALSGVRSLINPFGVGSDPTVNVKNSYDASEVASAISESTDPMVAKLDEHIQSGQGLNTRVDALVTALGSQEKQINLTLDKELLGKVILDTASNVSTPSGRQIVMSGGE